MATGARVRNAYPTFPLLRDSLPKGRLIPDGVQVVHIIWTKDLSVADGDAYHEIVGGVTAHLVYDV